MTSQQYGDHILSLWQLQAAIGIAPAARRLPANGNEGDTFERDLERVRQAMGEKQ